MNPNGFGKMYARLTAEERFRLLAAAAGRGDTAEAARIAAAGRRIAVSLPDHAPFVLALADMDLIVYVDLLVIATDFRDALRPAGRAEWAAGAEQDTEPEGGSAGGPGAGGGARPRAPWERLLAVALAYGFLLQVKAGGWELFCAGMGLPPYACWERLPGFERLRGALRLSRQAAFVPEGMLRWANEVRPAGAPEATDVGLSPESVASGLKNLYRERVAWWGGT